MVQHVMQLLLETACFLLPEQAVHANTSLSPELGWHPPGVDAVVCVCAHPLQPLYSRTRSGSCTVPAAQPSPPCPQPWVHHQPSPQHKAPLTRRQQQAMMRQADSRPSCQQRTYPHMPPRGSHARLRTPCCTAALPLIMGATLAACHHHRLLRQQPAAAWRACRCPAGRKSSWAQLTSRSAGRGH
jgi:hypothetical protein